MRVLLVSAHYPPNFVSGGSIQPQRLAAALRDRGDEVSVFAGWLDDAITPLKTWDDTDENGVPVRWVATTTRWTDWASRENFDNPDVTQLFAAHLAEVRPEVVHFHSLQSFGAGLLAAAKASGAQVVVTMHDFWWCCGRQFLVDRHYRPCSLLVAGGICECHVDRPWLEERNRELLGHLGNADLILSPSSSAAAVLSANGIGRHCPVRVDENGIPSSGSPAVRRSAVAGPLRLLYIGGPDPMKGVHILLDAAARLEARSGWRLIAYGIEPFLRAHRLPAGLPVEVRPPFAPEDIDDVFAGADVLVLPSVMRESHSLATREALQRGLPVICTDSLGPEEVVQHEWNGLVVPSADAAALAGAVARLLDEPALRRRLSEEAGPVGGRDVDDQADGLRALFHELPGGSPPHRQTGIRRVLFVVGIDGAPLRYRAQLPGEALGLLGVKSEVRYYRDPDLVARAAAADVIVVYRVPATVQIAQLLGDARARGTPLFFDVDDLIFDPTLAPEIPALQILSGDERDLWLQGVRRYRTTMEMCDAFIGSTAMLCAHAKEVTGLPAFRFDNGVGLVTASLSDRARHRPRREGPPRIAYLSGTNTHERDWAYVEPAIAEVLMQHADAELWLVGLVEPSAALDSFGERIVRVPPMPWTELPELLRDVDVNLAPLEPHSRFNEAKSAIKWLEAALTATPTVASPTEPFRTAIDDGRTGVLASTPEEWVERVGELVARDDLRARIGSQAQREALLRWSPYVQAENYLSIVSTRPPERRGALAWDPVVLDEPATALHTPLERYELPRPPARSLVRRVLSRARRHARAALGR